MAGALLLVVAEFTTLYQAHLATRSTPFQTVKAGSHNSWAMVPIGVAAALLGIAAWRIGGRLVVLGVAVLGVVGLVIALVHDLPDAHAVGLAQHNSVSATTTPSAGLYLETLGAILLIVSGGVGFLILGLPRPRRQAAVRSLREED
jgi:hypothetical protein